MKKYTLILLFWLVGIFPSIAHVDLLYPLGTESFVPGEMVNIEWEVLIDHNTLNWDLSFSSDGGTSWDTIALDLSPSTLSFQWEVPDIMTSQGRIRIIQDNPDTDDGDVSDEFAITSTTGINEVNIVTKLRVYPNPFRDYTTIEFDHSENTYFSLSIYDVHGRKVRSVHGMVEEEIRIKRGPLKDGLYFFQLFTDNEVQAIGRLIVE